MPPPKEYKANSVTVVDSLYVTGTVPVEFARLSAVLQKGSVVLTWTTISETNNFGFFIERNDHSNDWNMIGFVKGHGTTNIPQSYSFCDNNNMTGEYQYRLKQVDNNGESHYSEYIDVAVRLTIFTLYPNYPNPANPKTVIPFDLPVKSEVRLILINVLGEVVKEIFKGELKAGHHDMNCDVGDLSTGVYFYRFEAGDFIAVRKLLVMR